MPPGPRPAPHATAIRFLLIHVLGDIKEQAYASWSGDTIREFLNKHVRPLFDEPLERVNVLYVGEYRDMFVGETSAINGRHIRNVRATEIYRNNALSNKWAAHPEELPAISGPAALFPDYQVWR